MFTVSNDPGGNCGVRHIGGLKAYYGDAAQFMRDFHKKYAVVSYNDGKLVGGKALPARLTTFFMFSGCVADGGNKVTYASNIAEFIKKNKLGLLAESRPLRNSLYPEGHLIKVYIWHPNTEAINKWVEADAKANPAPPAEAPKPVW